MDVNQMDVIVRQEHNKDLRQEAKWERLAGAVEAPSSAARRLLHKLVEWFSAPRMGADSLPPSPTLASVTGK